MTATELINIVEYRLRVVPDLSRNRELIEFHLNSALEQIMNLLPRNCLDHLLESTTKSAAAGGVVDLSSLSIFGGMRGITAIEFHDTSTPITKLGYIKKISREEYVREEWGLDSFWYVESQKEIVVHWGHARSGFGGGFLSEGALIKIYYLRDPGVIGTTGYNYEKLGSAAIVGGLDDEWESITSVWSDIVGEEIDLDPVFHTVIADFAESDLWHLAGDEDKSISAGQRAIGKIEIYKRSYTGTDFRNEPISAYPAIT